MKARLTVLSPPLIARSEFGAGCDADLRQKFAQQVTVLRSDLQKWSSKQSKQVGSATACMPPYTCNRPANLGRCGARSTHSLRTQHAFMPHPPKPVDHPHHRVSLQVMSGVPVVAVLMCLEGHDQLVTTIDGFIDQLHKLLRDRRAASMALLCLTRVVSCFLRRMAARSDAGGSRQSFELQG